MSLESWKAEYYPVEAMNVMKERAIEHSLRKWRGLRREALISHGLVGRSIIEEEDSEDSVSHSLVIASNSCALCTHYYNFDEYTPCCSRCPLKLIRGVRCDLSLDEADPDSDDSPYHAFTLRGDPEPMIALLEEALKRKENPSATK